VMDAWSVGREREQMQGEQCGKTGSLPVLPARGSQTNGKWQP
jgi:hypothetical protein